MNGSNITSVILAVTLLVVVVAVAASLLYCIRRRRRHRVFLAGNILESGYSIHHGSDQKRSNFHARPFTVSPPPEDFVVVTEDSDLAKNVGSPQTSPSLPSPPSTEESTVEEELQEPPRVFRLDVTGLVERHNEHHESFDETSLAIADFDTTFFDLTADENERLNREFKSLNRSFFGDQSTDEANHVENIKKNRYFNVLPYDFNRVRLREVANGRSDYINASGIKAPNHHGLRYIVAQGPIGDDEVGRESTVADFWQMIWEQKIECIVMLSECIERGKTKCAMYWPENAGEGISVGGRYDVHLYCVTEDEICFQRELHVRREGETRKIVQWHFKDWRDAEAPEDSADLLEFIRAISESRPCDPILVHCSAGVGRSGVFIAVDILLECVEDQRTPCVNVFEMVHTLRSQRSEMVKNEQQYAAVYRTLLLAIRQRNRCVVEVREEEMSEVDI